MMSHHLRFGSTVALVLGTGLAVLTTASAARAAVLLEHSFHNAPSGGDITAQQQTAGASDTFTLLGGATVNTAGSGPASGIPDILTGVIHFAGYTSGTPQDDGMVSKATSGANHQYRDYITGGDSAGYGTSTVMMVYKPDHSGPSYSTEGSRDLFGHANVGGVGNRLRLVIRSGNLSIVVGSASAELAEPSWNPNAWYLIGASWKKGDVATVYWREITTGSTANFLASAGVVPTTGDTIMIRPVYIGQSSDSNGAAKTDSSADGSMSYFLWTDDYTKTQAAFDAIYDTLIPIPEPASMMLMAGGLVLLRRR